ncbi:hypothetical protein SCALM49S_08910 [Streptomyces californicus]
MFRLNSGPSDAPAANREAEAAVNSWYARAPITASATRSRSAVSAGSPASRHRAVSRPAAAR